MGLCILEINCFYNCVATSIETVVIDLTRGEFGLAAAVLNKKNMTRIKVSRRVMFGILIVTVIVLCIVTSWMEGDTPQMYLSRSASQSNEPKEVFNKLRSVLGWKGDQQLKSPATNIAPDAWVKDVNCKLLFDGDQQEIEKAMKIQENYTRIPLDFNKTSDCFDFRRERGYVETPGTPEEESFSIAFTIIMFKDAEQVERLLRAIYRPQNYYCIHVDKKSPMDVQVSIRYLASCFPNVILASNPVDVRWGRFSNLECDLICMRDLLQFKRWRYLINLTGQEFPLKTNLDLVRILKAYNGANDIFGTIKRRQKGRTAWIFKNGKNTKIAKPPPPYNMTLTKGSLKVLMSRGFVDFVLNSVAGKRFTEWIKETAHPDESFFTSLNHNPQLGVPGSFIGEPDSKSWLVRYVVWAGQGNCSGKFARAVCVFGLGDLARLRAAPQLFANKFHYNYQPLALDCMEQLHFERTREDILRLADSSERLNMSVYETMPFVKSHVGLSSEYPVWTPERDKDVFDIGLGNFTNNTFATMYTHTTQPVHATGK